MWGHNRIVCFTNSNNNSHSFLLWKWVRFKGKDLRQVRSFNCRDKSTNFHVCWLHFLPQNFINLWKWQDMSFHLHVFIVVSRFHCRIGAFFQPYCLHFGLRNLVYLMHLTTATYRLRRSRDDEREQCTRRTEYEFLQRYRPIDCSIGRGRRSR